MKNINLVDKQLFAILSSNELFFINKFILVMERALKVKSFKSVELLTEKIESPELNSNSLGICFGMEINGHPHSGAFLSIFKHWKNLEVPVKKPNFFNDTEARFYQFFESLTQEDINIYNRKELYETWLINYFKRFKNQNIISEKEINVFCQNIDLNTKQNYTIHYNGESFILLSNDISEISNTYEKYKNFEMVDIGNVLNEICDIFFESSKNKQNELLISYKLINNECNKLYSVKDIKYGNVIEIKINDQNGNFKTFNIQTLLGPNYLNEKLNNSYKKEALTYKVFINENNFSHVIKTLFTNLFNEKNIRPELFYFKTYKECEAEDLRKALSVNQSVKSLLIK